METNDQTSQPSGVGSKDLLGHVPAPIAKHELVMIRCPYPRAISVCVATKRAHQWLKVCVCYFDNIASVMLGDGNQLPMTTTLIVPECYDFEEVWSYVADKPWVRQVP